MSSGDRLAGEQLAELVGDGGGGQARVDGADGAVEVQEQPAVAGDDGVERGSG